MAAEKTRRLPGQTVTCGWCGTRVALKSTGRVPTGCSETCRHRAWEQRRSAASDRAPVEVVDHVAEVEKQVRVVERVEVARPTLDGVFLGLTGRSLRESQSTTENESEVAA